MIYKIAKEFTRKYYKYKEQMPSNIPNTYKCLGSITGGGFNSNIQMTHNTSIECESALVANDTNWQYLINNDGSSGTWFIVGKEQTGTPFTRHFLSSYGSLGVNPTVNQFYHFFIDMSATTKRFYIDNNLVYSPSDSSTGNLGNTLSFNHDKYKSKYFKTYNSNMELEHYIVPVKRIADDKLGWYDTITDIFYTDSLIGAITAYEELEYEEGTPSDYDFYKDVDIYKAVKETNSGITQWTQPPYSDWVGNNNSTWDTSRLYTCTCDGSYNTSSQPGVASLAGSGAGWHSRTSSLPHWVGYYTEPIKVSKFGFQVNGTSDYVPTTFSWQGSHDGSSWTTLGTFTRDGDLTTSYEEYTIPESNRDFYEFNRLYITGGNRNFQYICNVNITADVLSLISLYKVIQKTERKYYKCNINSIGNLTNNNGILSGFSSGDYAYPSSITSLSNSVSNASSWEFQAKFRLTNTSSIYQHILGGDGGSFTPDISIYPDNRFRLNLSSNGNSYNICEASGTHVVDLNTDYIVKLKFTGSQYVLSYSTNNGTTFTDDIVVNSSTKIRNTSSISYLGCRGNLGGALVGSINLNKSYLKVSNQLIWQGVEESTQFDYDFYEDVDIYKVV